MSEETRIQEPEDLLAGYAAGILTRDQTRRLAAAALDDQEIFERMAEEEKWRQIYDQPGMRQRLLEALSPEPSAWGWLRRVLRPAVAVPLTALATAALAFLIVQPPPAQAPEPGLLKKGVEGMAPAVTVEETARLVLERESADGAWAVPTELNAGDRVRLRFSGDWNGIAYLFRPEESVTFIEELAVEDGMLSPLTIPAAGELRLLLSPEEGPQVEAPTETELTGEEDFVDWRDLGDLDLSAGDDVLLRLSAEGSPEE